MEINRIKRNLTIILSRMSVARGAVRVDNTIKRARVIVF